VLSCERLRVGRATRRRNRNEPGMTAVLVRHRREMERDRILASESVENYITLAGGCPAGICQCLTAHILPRGLDVKHSVRGTVQLTRIGNSNSEG